MRISDLGNLIRPSSPLRPDDTLAKAVRQMRARGLPALPVAEGGRLVGLVREEDAAAAADSPDPRLAARSLRVADVMRPIGFILVEGQPLTSLREALRDPPNAVLPVARRDGGYLGLLLRRDALAALYDEPLVPPVAGLATPFGVHLTTGALRAGAGDLSLAATGACLMLLNLLAGALVFGLLLLARWAAPQLESLRTGDYLYTLVVVAFYLLQLLVFLLLLRFSPLAGVHAAEHMVVHAIEEGEDLALEKIRSMSRVHPRCGTNLMALLILVIIAQRLFASISGRMGQAAELLAMLALVIAVLLAWRRLGAGLQRWVTTRPPSDRQLARAIAVGEALLEKIRQRPGARARLPRRVWNSGFLQVMGGFIALIALVEYARPWLAPLWRRLVG